MANESNGGFCATEIIGVVLAIVLSWTKNASILWAILHALCGWFYVIYYAIFC